ncbi:hypothetical protein VTH82DRAFT_5836 [Thermothelomyces myriococcoides]
MTTKRTEREGTIDLDRVGPRHKGDGINASQCSLSISAVLYALYCGQREQSPHHLSGGVPDEPEPRCLLCEGKARTELFRSDTPPQ